MSDYKGADRMTQEIVLYRKGTIGTSSPEAWDEVHPRRRAEIVLVSDNTALREAAAYDVNTTHHAWVDYRDDYQPTGRGARLIKRVSDGQNFLVHRVVGAGKVGRTGHQRYLRLSLAAIDPPLK